MASSPTPFDSYQARELLTDWALARDPVRQLDALIGFSRTTRTAVARRVGFERTHVFRVLNGERPMFDDLRAALESNYGVAASAEAWSAGPGRLKAPKPLAEILKPSILISTPPARQVLAWMGYHGTGKEEMADRLGVSYNWLWRQLKRDEGLSKSVADPLRQVLRAPRGWAR